MSSGCCSEVPASSLARCRESVWCQTPQVYLAFRHRHTHTPTHTTLDFGQICSTYSLLFSDTTTPAPLPPPPSVSCTFHPVRASPSLSANKNHISLTYTQGHIVRHTASLPYAPQWTGNYSEPLTQSPFQHPLLNSLSASWRAKWLGMTCLTSLWPRIKHTIYCLAQEMTSLDGLQQMLPK